MSEPADGASTADHDFDCETTSIRRLGGRGIAIQPRPSHAAGSKRQSDLYQAPQHGTNSLKAVDYCYGLRRCFERYINWIKHYGRIATRFKKTACSFFSMLCLAAAMI